MDRASVASSVTSQKSHNLFQVYLRLRPAASGAAATSERFIAVEEQTQEQTAPTHITLNPPNDRRRAIEKFAFTQVFEEDATQLDVFHCTNVVSLVEGVLAPHGGEGTDALLATLGVTGSGKTHTILGSRTQRGLTQLSLDVIFQSLGNNILDCSSNPGLEASISASDSSEAGVFSASAFLDTVYADQAGLSRSGSRAPTPLIVRPLKVSCRIPPHSYHHHPPDPCNFDIYTTEHEGCETDEEDGASTANSPKTVRIVRREDYTVPCSSPPMSPSLATLLEELREQQAVATSRNKNNNSNGMSQLTGPPKLRDVCDQYHTMQQQLLQQQQQQRHRTLNPKSKSPTKHFMASTASMRLKIADTKTDCFKSESSMGPPPTPSRRLLNRPSALPQQPDVSALSIACDPASEYAVVISMYEVYNDRIFDLLTPPTKSAATKEYRRRPLLFKSTEGSPDRKLVAGLRKIICGSLQQALLVLEAGLHERRVAGTGSNSVSSRSHGFFCVEVKKRSRSARRYGGAWGGNTMTIVDLAGSERARDAKTAGATLAEAGKINESLMYLGQCLQMQSDAASKDKPNLVPFRQCKLTELLFSNSFPSASSYSSSTTVRRNPQKAVMIVTADPHGDFNATSQILRYSALAREITVPRIPSITQTILEATRSAPPAVAAPTEHPSHHAGPGSSPTGSPTPLHSRPFFPLGSSGSGSSSGSSSSSSSSSSSHQHMQPQPHMVARTFSDEHRSTMELAALEIARLAEELDYMREALQAEQAARMEAEAHLLSMEDRMLELEQAIREDCTLEFERRLELELARWRVSMQLEMERGEEHWGRKIEVFERSMAAAAAAAGGNAMQSEDDGGFGFGGVGVGVGVGVGADENTVGGEDKENVLMEDVGEENERLRRDNEILRRELAALSPAKRVPLQERGGDMAGSGAGGGNNNNNNNSNNARNMSKSAATAESTGSLRGAHRRHGSNGGGAAGNNSLQRKMERLRVSDDSASVRSLNNGSPKKMRKLANKRWDSALDGDDDDVL